MISKPNISGVAMIVRHGQSYHCDGYGAEKFVSINQPATVLINLNNSYVYWYQSA